MAAIVTCMGSLGINHVNAQPGKTSGGDAELTGRDPSVPLDAPLMDDSHALRVFRFAEEWLTQGEIKPAPPVRVAGLYALRVSLRWSGGRPMAMGQIDAVPTTAGGGADLTAAVSSAMRIAFKSLESQLRQSVQTGGKGGDADAPRAMSDLTPRLTLDLQLAGPPQAIRIEPDGDPDQLYRQFAPGFHGLRMTRDGADNRVQVAWQWPGSVVATNTSPHSQVVQMLNELGYKPEDAVRVGRTRAGRVIVPVPAQPSGGATGAAPTDTTGGSAAPKRGVETQGPPPIPLQRFNAIHVVRPSLREEPVVLVRGGEPLPAASLDGEAVDKLAEGFAGFLERRLIPEAGMTGTYLPTSDNFDPILAPPEDVALSALALTRWAKQARDSGRTDKAVLAAETAVRRAATQLVRATFPYPEPDAGQPDPGPLRASPATSALCLMVTLEAPYLGLSQQKPMRDRFARHLLSLRNADGSLGQLSPLASDPNATRESLTVNKAMNLTNHALIVAALTAWYESTREPEQAAWLRVASAWFWSRADASRIVAALPWVMDADLAFQRLAPAQPAPVSPPPALAATAPATQPKSAPPLPDRYADVLHLLAERQVVRAPETSAQGPADVVGGYDLTAAPPGAPPLPDWSTTLVMRSFAIALREPALIPKNRRIDTILACGLAARFVKQITFNESACFYVRSREDCLGGLRNAPWDNRLTNAGAANALLACTEFQRSLAQIARP